MIRKVRDWWSAFRISLYLVKHPEALIDDDGDLTLSVLCAWTMILQVEKGFVPTLKDKYKLSALLHTEVSEYVDAIKKGLPKDDVESEVADIFIRACNLVLAEKMDIAKAIRRKMGKNFGRPWGYGTIHERK